MWRVYSNSVTTMCHKLLITSPCRHRIDALSLSIHQRKRNISLNARHFSLSAQAHEELLKVLEMYKSTLKVQMCDVCSNGVKKISKESNENQSKEPLNYQIDYFPVYSSSTKCCNYSPVTHSPQNLVLNPDRFASETCTSILDNLPPCERIANSANDFRMNVSQPERNPFSYRTNNATDYNFKVTYDPSSLQENIYDTTVKLEMKENEFSNSGIEQIEKVKDVNNQEKKKKTVKHNVELMKIQKGNFLSRSLKSYIQVCSVANMVYKAHETFLFYRYKNAKSTKVNCSFDIDVYNSLLNCWAEQGNIEKMKEIFSLMNDDSITPNMQSYMAHLECLARIEHLCPDHVNVEVKKIVETLKTNEYNFDDIFRKCVFSHDQMNLVLNLLQKHSDIVPTSYQNVSHTPYSCKLLEKLNDKNYEKSEVPPYINNCIKFSNIVDLTSDQMQLETKYFVKVGSVNSSDEVNEKTIRMRKCVEQCEETFRKDLMCALDKKLRNLHDDVMRQKTINLYPYLHVIDRNLLLDILLQEIKNLAETAEFFSPNIKILCQTMGVKVMNHYFIWLRKRNKITDKVSFIYIQYLKYLLTPELATAHTPREYWEHLKRLYYTGPTIDIAEVAWPKHVLHEVGKFLYDTLMEDASFDISKLKGLSKKNVKVRPFYTTYERSKKSTDAITKSILQIRAHPKICQLYREAKLEHLEFDVSMVPMVCPPRPWVKIEVGGLVMTSIPFIRLPTSMSHEFASLRNVNSEELNPCFDSLNSLSLCPWLINKPVLDLIIDVFKNNGCEELDVPVNPSVLPEPPTVKTSMSDDEKRNARRAKAILKKKKMEMTGLWFDCLYKLSIAYHFRDRVFWFPHNLDFRGRVYPTPPHFNHLGSDMVRGILLFAEGKPLGKNGLDWLKIHLINLTGMKKREPNRERLKYANSIMSEVLDSADKPLTGNKWWQSSDEPWQTLACCMEIANAIRSENPESYVSYFPVHQDGSCNGLQHYAALGRDELGAREVNLTPASSPHDVYSGVAVLVEAERRRDAFTGNEIARILDGIVKRKVVKQTVMTFVYGVTEYGARLQILKQLKDIPELPEQNQRAAALYLMKLTFSSIQKMFTATREIQKWFTDCAELITKISGEPVEWVTPMGLPVVQPYHKKTTVGTSSTLMKTGRQAFHLTDERYCYTSTIEKYQPPNVRKQKNAFAPNFIHSLDSSHMMLTALFSQRIGITFVSVHDCYWTHPASVEIMNKICREQFVALHSQPILEDLSHFFIKKYGQYFPSSRKEDSVKQRNRLIETLSQVPQKGTFNLENVINSEYFFS